MPDYAHLLRKPLHFGGIPARVRAMHTLGAPYTPEELRDAERLAREQARAIAAQIVEQGGREGLEETEVVALIAYLERLGVDLFKTPPAEDATDAPAAARRADEDPIRSGTD